MHAGYDEPPVTFTIDKLTALWLHSSLLGEFELYVRLRYIHCFQLMNFASVKKNTTIISNYRSN